MNNGHRRCRVVSLSTGQPRPAASATPRGGARSRRPNRSEDATSPVEALDPRLRTNRILDQRDVNPESSRKSRELSGGRLEDPLASVPDRSFSARPYASRLSLFCPRLSVMPATRISVTCGKASRRPRALQSLFEDQMLLAGIIRTLRPEPETVSSRPESPSAVARLRNHRERTARCMHIDEVAKVGASRLRRGSRVGIQQSRERRHRWERYIGLARPHSDQAQVIPRA